MSDNGNGAGRHAVSIPIAVGVLALLLGIGGTVFFFGGSVRQIDFLQAEVDTIRREFRPREFWEQNSSEIAALKLQVAELVLVRDRAIPEWTMMMQRIASLEAHFNDLSARAQIVSGDIRDELNFYRNSAARRLENTNRERVGGSGNLPPTN